LWDDIAEDVKLDASILLLLIASEYKTHPPPTNNGEANKKPINRNLIG
jgi:hypothetical protein